MCGYFCLLYGAVLLLTLCVVPAEQEHKWNIVFLNHIEQCVKIARHKSQVPQVVIREIYLCYRSAVETLTHETTLRMDIEHVNLRAAFLRPLVKLRVISSNTERKKVMEATIELKSHEMLRGNLTFTHFNMAYSGVECPYDSMALIDTNTHQKLCGIRDKYSYFSVRQEISLIILATVVMPFDIKLIFQPVDIGQVRGKFNPTVSGISDPRNVILEKTKSLQLPNDFYFGYIVRYKSSFYEGLTLTWKLRADAGFSVNVTMGELTYVQLLQMYEGGILLPEMLKFQYENQTQNGSAVSDISSIGPVLTVIVHSRYEHFGQIYYTQEKADLQRKSLSVGSRRSVSISDMCKAIDNVIYCLVTLETRNGNNYINLTIDSYMYKGPDSFDCMYSEILLYDGKFKQLAQTSKHKKNSLLAFYSPKTIARNVQVFTFCREEPELYKWSFISGSSTFSILLVGYTSGNTNYHTEFSASVVATKCRGIWRGSFNVSRLSELEFVPYGCSIRQERPYRGSDHTVTKLDLWNMNDEVSKSALHLNFLLKFKNAKTLKYVKLNH